MPKKRVNISRDISKKRVILFWTLSKLSEPFENRPDPFKTVRTLSKLSGPFQNRPDPFKTVRTLSKPSGSFQNCLDHFKNVQTVLRLSGQFSNSVDNVEVAHTALKLIIIRSFKYEKLCLYCLNGIQTNQANWAFQNEFFIIRAKFFRTRNFFPDTVGQV